MKYTLSTESSLLKLSVPSDYRSVCGSVHVLARECVCRCLPACATVCVYMNVHECVGWLMKHISRLVTRMRWKKSSWFWMPKGPSTTQVSARIHMCAVTRLCVYVWHDSFWFVTWLVLNARGASDYTVVRSHSHVWRDRCMHMCDTSRLYAWHDSIPHLWRDSFICVAWPIYDVHAWNAKGSSWELSRPLSLFPPALPSLLPPTFCPACPLRSLFLPPFLPSFSCIGTANAHLKSRGSHTHTCAHTVVLLLEANIDQAKKAGAQQAVEVMTMLKDKAGTCISVTCLIQHDSSDMTHPSLSLDTFIPVTWLIHIRDDHAQG